MALRPHLGLSYLRAALSLSFSLLSSLSSRSHSLQSNLVFESYLRHSIMFSKALVSTLYGLSIIAPVLTVPATGPTSAGVCNADNCLRAFRAASPSTRQADASSYCSSYLSTSVAAVTVYTTTSTTATTTASTSTITASTTVTEIDTT